MIPTLLCSDAISRCDQDLQPGEVNMFRGRETPKAGGCVILFVLEEDANGGAGYEVTTRNR